MTTVRPQWDEFFIQLARFYATRSKDPSTKVGAVLVRPDKTVAGMGYNGFPRAILDSEENLNHRDLKYPRMVHAEMNALLTCRDQNIAGYTLYCSFMPCDRCFILLLHSGITRFVFPKPTPDELTRWGKSFEQTRQIAKESSVVLTEIEI